MPPLRAPSLLAGLTALAAATTALLVTVSAQPGRSREPKTEPSEAGPVAVLGEWDRRRAGAWAEGSPASLGSLYTPGSSAGTADRAMLRRYAARGLRVQGLVVQRLAVRVLRREPDVLMLRVTDRMVGATAVGRGLRVRLPRDGVSTRTVTLRRVGSDWRVSEVLPVGRRVRPAPPR